MTAGDAGLPRIPGGTRFRPDMLLMFVRYPRLAGGWHVMGPAERLVSGETVEVVRFGGLFKPTTLVEVVVGDVVAERWVKHRAGRPVRYVVVGFSRTGREVL